MDNLALTVRSAIERGLDKYELPHNESVIRLLLMIAAHESGGFAYCKQVRGPALGIFQMEPPTYSFVMSYLGRTGKFKEIHRNEEPERMVVDAEFAAAIARVYLWSKPEPIPDSDDIWGLAEYAKKHWNTEMGKATPQKYYDDFVKYVGLSV